MKKICKNQYLILELKLYGRFGLQQTSLKKRYSWTRLYRKVDYNTFSVGHRVASEVHIAFVAHLLFVKTARIKCTRSFGPIVTAPVARLVCVVWRKFEAKHLRERHVATLP